MASCGTSFAPVVHAVEIDYTRIDKLLKEAIKIWDSKVPPEGREGCKNCKKLEALFALQEMVENEMGVRDRKAIEASRNDPWVIGAAVRRVEDRRSARLTALYELEEEGDSFDFDDGTRILDEMLVM